MREKERKLLLFAGTTEGRMLAEYLSKKRIACYVSTATEYGKSLLQEEQLSDIIILAGRMNEEEIKTFLTEKKIDCVVDATHPFAKIVTENIVNACKETQTGYIRCLREMETSSEDLAGQEQVRVFESVKAMQRGSRVFKYDRRKDSDYDREQRIERIYKDRKLSGKMLCEGVIDKSSDGRKREAGV